MNSSSKIVIGGEISEGDLRDILIEVNDSGNCSFEGYWGEGFVYDPEADIKETLKDILDLSDYEGNICIYACDATSENLEGIESLCAERGIPFNSFTETDNGYGTFGYLRDGKCFFLRLCDNETLIPDGAVRRMIEKYEKEGILDLEEVQEHMIPKDLKPLPPLKIKEE